MSTNNQEKQDFVNIMLTLPRRIIEQIEAEAIYTEDTMTNVIIGALEDRNKKNTELEIVLSNGGEAFIKPAGEPMPNC